MVKNLDKNISEIKYNVLNLPSQITTGADKEYKITYTYDALGRKLQAYYRRKTMDVIIPKRQQAKSITLSSRIGDIIGKPVLPDTLVKDTMSTAPSEAEWLSSKITYSGNLIFTGNRVTVLNPHGYTTIDTNKTTGEQTTTRYYYLKDHLGSNRVVFRGDGTVVQQNHYYAYGGLTAESTGGTQQSYKYNGKEFDRKLGLDLYDYGARWYDPVGSSSFTTIDPLCEKYYSVSPYAYCANNPVNAIDPDGRKIRPSIYNTINRKGNTIESPYVSYVKFIEAMTMFGSTDYGKNFIGSFLEKGQIQYGVSGNGKYSNYTLNIQEMGYDNPKDNALYMGGSNNGVFKISEQNNQLIFILQLDCSHQTKEELVETITHEATLHGYKIGDIVDAYRKGGYEKAKEIFNKQTETQEHEDAHNQHSQYGGKFYNQVFEELNSQYPNIDKIFEKRRH